MQPDVHLEKSQRKSNWKKSLLFNYVQKQTKDRVHLSKNFFSLLYYLINIIIPLFFNTSTIMESGRIYGLL